MAKVFLARTARKALEELDFLLADAVVDALGELERDPQAGYPLRGRLAGLWSYRVGALPHHLPGARSQDRPGRRHQTSC